MFNTQCRSFWQIVSQRPASVASVSVSLLGLLFSEQGPPQCFLDHQNYLLKMLFPNLGAGMLMGDGVSRALQNLSLSESCFHL